MITFDNQWEEVHQSREWGRYPSEEVIRFVARNFYNKDRKQTRLLDAGCGTGAIAWYLARESFDTYGFDGSETALKKAKKRMKDEDLSIQFQLADACSIPYEDLFFDGVVDAGMIVANTIDGIKKILGECYRVLKTGGKFFSTALFRREMTGYGTGIQLEEHTFRNITKGSLSGIGTIHFFDQDEIRKLWSEIGFKNIKIDYSVRSDNNGQEIVSHFFVEAEK